MVADNDHQQLPDGTVGQIFVQSPSLASGYWRRSEATQATFHNRLRGKDGLWLATGDLGFIEADRDTGDTHLCVTGRAKDLIIVHGRNVYPTDVERVVMQEAGDETLRPGSCAVVQVDNNGGIAVTAELRTGRTFTEKETERISRVLAGEFSVSVKQWVILKQGRALKTTSGKLRRASTKRRTRSKSWRNSAVALQIGDLGDLGDVDAPEVMAEHDARKIMQQSSRRASLTNFLKSQDTALGGKAGSEALVAVENENEGENNIRRTESTLFASIIRSEETKDAIDECSGTFADKSIGGYGDSLGVQEEPVTHVNTGSDLPDLPGFITGSTH